MTVAKVWDGATWIPIVGAQGPIGPQGPPGGLMAIQRDYGASENYHTNVSPGAGTHVIEKAAGSALQIAYTPTVDAWWEVNFQISQLLKQDAAYHYIYGGLVLTPPDVDGSLRTYALVTQHQAVNQYEPRHGQRIFKLAAGVPYVCNVQLTGSSGGSWSYFMGSQHLILEGKAWAR